MIQKLRRLIGPFLTWAQADLRFFHWIARPFEQTGLQMLDRRIYDFLVGIDYLTKGGVSVQGGAIEDFKNSGDAGADITFFLTVGKDF